ncbi:MAG: tetratricopeptide repeat protein [Acidobacteriota bacterium]
MAYPGDPSLDTKVQQRILTAFGEAARLFREGHGDESRTILRSILEVDPKFGPAQRLEGAIATGASVDLNQLLGEVSAAAPLDLEGLVAKARLALTQRDFEGASTLVQAVLRELPGHAEARQLAAQIQERVRAIADVESHVTRGREAARSGRADEARAALAQARALDASHPGVAELSREVETVKSPALPEPDFEFEAFGEPPPPPVPAAPPPRPGPAAPSAASPKAATAMPAAPGGQPEAGGGQHSPGNLFTFDEADDGAAFEFDTTLPEPTTAQAAPDRVRSLLDQGQAAFDQGDYQSAIDTWSRIYLVEAHNPEVEQRIEEARRRREEADRAAEHRFYEAREAFEQGRLDDARSLCREVLQLQPQHLEAHDLLQRMETPAVPPPAPAAAAEVSDEDLFQDEFVPIAAPAPASGEQKALLPEPVEAVARKAGRAVAKARRGLPIPLPLIGIVALVVVLLAVGGYFLRDRVFSRDGNAIAQSLDEAGKLAQGGRLQEAINLLQSLQGQADGEEWTQLSQRVLEYQRRLKAQTTANRKTDTSPIREELAAGRRIKALRMVREALAKAPSDPDVTALQSEIVQASPNLPALLDAFAAGRWDAARQLASQSLRTRDDAEVRRVWATSTFNQAVVALRQYKVAEANGLLEELIKVTEDPESRRLKEMSVSYLSKPVDPRYQIFVSNLQMRALE